MFYARYEYFNTQRNVHEENYIGQKIFAPIEDARLNIPVLKMK